MHHELLCIVCRNIWVTHTLKHIRTHCVYIKNVFFKLRVWIFFKIESFCVQGQVFFLNSPIFLDYSLFSDCLLTHDIVSKLGSWVEIGNFCLWTESFSASNTCCQLCVCVQENGSFAFLKIMYLQQKSLWPDSYVMLLWSPKSTVSSLFKRESQSHLTTNFTMSIYYNSSWYL